jgi:alpha-amylase
MLWTIPIQDETKPVNFIVHKPSGDTVPVNREPGGDRSFTPATNHEIWLKENDATIYTSQPG